MLLSIVFALFLGAFVLADVNYPKDVVTIEVNCPGNAKDFFQCTPKWNEEDDTGLMFRDSAIKFADMVRKRKDAGYFYNGEEEGEKIEEISLDELAGYQGNELYNEALQFFGLSEDEYKMADFLAISYYLDFFANNTYSVSSSDDPNTDGIIQVIGFAGGLFSSEGVPYPESFVDGLRDITIQYKISFGDKEGEFCYAIGYFGTFSLPYFYCDIDNTYVNKFSVAYNADYNWSNDFDGSFTKYLDLFKEGNTKTIPPGIFMINLIAPNSDEVNTYDPLGEKNANGETAPETQAPINMEKFKHLFGLRYGIRTMSGQSFTDNIFAYSATPIEEGTYSAIKEGSWNYCRSLGRNNIADEEFNPEGQDYDYSYAADIIGEGKSYLCNPNNLPSVFFMTHNLDGNNPNIFSTKYQLMVDGACQYRTDLNKDDFPATKETSVKFGVEGSVSVDNLPKKNIFILNGNDFLAPHIVETTNLTNNPEVEYNYDHYIMNENHDEDLYYHTPTMCNTALSDIYVLYDMKQYANVYGSIGAITKDSYGFEAVYNSMRTYPTKSNYTAVVTTNQYGGKKPGQKTQLQKCVNVFLDTNGSVVAACNDVTSTWNWAVFGGSLAGIFAIGGLWGWGAWYNKKFNEKNPPYYTDLVNYEAEWKEIQKREQEEKEQKKKQKKGRKTQDDESSLTKSKKEEDSSNRDLE